MVLRGDNGAVNPTESPDASSFAEVLTEAIQRRGLSLERIRTRLDAAGVPVSIATLSYWQSGRSFPTRARSYHSLVELEKILNVDAGYLTTLTHTADGRTRKELFEWQKVVPVADLVQGILADLGIDMQGLMSRVLTTDLLTIGPERGEVEQSMRTVFRAEHSGTHRWPVVLEAEGDDHVSPRVEALFGCQLGEIVSVPERRLTVVEMIAPRLLQRGDHFTAEWKIRWTPAPGPSHKLERAIAEPMRGLGMGVRFHPDAVPARMESRYRPTMNELDDPGTTAVEIPISGLEAQHVRIDVKPGVYGLYWSWDD